MKSCFLSLLSFHPRIQSLHINYTYTNNCRVGVQGGPSVDVSKGLLRVHEKLNKREKKGLDFCPPTTSLRGQEASTVVTKTGEFPVWAGIQVFGSFQFKQLCFHHFVSLAPPGGRLHYSFCPTSFCSSQWINLALSNLICSFQATIIECICFTSSPSLNSSHSYSHSLQRFKEVKKILAFLKFR